MDVRFHEIDVEGVKYPIYYGIAALNDFLKLHDIVSLKDLPEFMDNLSLDAIINVVWVGLKHGHRLADKEFVLTQNNAADLIDRDFGIFQKCMDLFTEAMPKASENGQETGNQKAPKTNLRRSQ